MYQQNTIDWQTFRDITARRVNWWLEKNKLDEDLIGFRPNCNTTDAIQIIEIIRQAIKEKKYALVKCLEIEKAFDSANQDTILIKAKNISLGGRVIRWINNFLNEQNFPNPNWQTKIYYWEITEWSPTRIPK